MCDTEFVDRQVGTLDVRVRGNTLPPTISNRFHILLAILRQVHLVLAIAFFGHELRDLKPDVFVVDQLSACVPLLRWICPDRVRTLFYCHFPDQLLADRREGGLRGLVKRIYRVPFDWFEGWSTAASDAIVVNSKFTKTVAERIIPSQEPLTVIYPCVGSADIDEMLDKPLWDDKFRILLSINRFERKKDIGLAIKAYIGLSKSEREGTRLVLAGGYDHRVAENVQYHQELVDYAEQQGLSTATARTVPTALGIPDSVDVLFLLSVPSSFKVTLLRQARLLLYTPMNEHFGIVPVEAMQQGLPVLASNTGGPLETVVDGETGWLRDASKPEEWTAVIQTALSSDKAALQRIQKAGKKRVAENFTRPTMAKKFEDEITKMLGSKRSEFVDSYQILMALALVGAFAAALITVVMAAAVNRGGDGRATEFAKAKRMGLEKEWNPFQFVPGML